MKTTISALAAALALAAGSASASPHLITSDEAAQFKVGVATYDQVTAALGKPASVTIQSDGVRIIVYAMGRTHVKAATFIPIVGLFAGGATGETSTATFTFGPDGALTSSTFGRTSANCSTLGNCDSGLR